MIDIHKCMTIFFDLKQRLLFTATYYANGKQMVIKNSRASLCSLLCHIVPMVLSCLIKDEKAKLLSVISKASSETQYNLISLPIMWLFSSIIKTTERSLQRKREIVQAVSWSAWHRGDECTPRHTHTHTRAHMHAHTHRHITKLWNTELRVQLLHDFSTSEPNWWFWWWWWQLTLNVMWIPTLYEILSVVTRKSYLFPCCALWNKDKGKAVKSVKTRKSKRTLNWIILELGNIFSRNKKKRPSI